MFGHDSIKQVKIALVVAALLIAAGSLAISQILVSDLKDEEHARMAVWAEAMRSLIRADENTDLSLVLKIINSNHTIPIIVQDEQGNIIDHRNVNYKSRPDSLEQMQDKALAMRRSGHVMYLEMNPEVPASAPSDATVSASESAESVRFTISYGESVMLQRLAIFPFIQLGVVGLFIAVAIYALLSSKRAEQNKVWVGLSRETAHQLGTPISSLMAWTEVLRETYPDEPAVSDLTQDVSRLQLIADRFSKIGSAPSLQPSDLTDAISQAVAYVSRRASGKVHFTLATPPQPIIVNLNIPLFAWVVENLCKNAIDAMSGVGAITITTYTDGRQAIIEIADTGKGIPKSQFKTVFRPGFTTKRRGWGLGLSLAKRIVEQYHSGSIVVKSSEIGVGTTFCIRLPL